MGFLRRGHDVAVITSYPSYNVDVAKLPQQYRTGFRLREQWNGLDVLRIRSLRLPRVVPWLRALDQAVSALMFACTGLFFPSRRADVILVYSPPLFFGAAGLCIRFFRGSKVVLNVQDLFPQQAVDLGLLKNGMVIRFFRRLESFLYRRVDAVAVHSEGNTVHVLQHGGRKERLYVAPNVVDTQEIQPGGRDNAFRRRYGIPVSEFVVSFGGVLGYNQDLDSIVEAARLLAEVPGVVFTIVGDGVEKPRLLQMAEGMKNIRFLPMLPKEEYIELLHASDVGLVTLRAAVKTPVVPSKILSIMAAGRAVVASLPPGGDAPKLIREADCGLCVPPEDGAALAHAVLTLAQDPEHAARLGRNGRECAVQNLTVEVCVSRYEQVFGSVTSSQQ
jgi:glycosyltransferase involved in cell wall biosynthesis